MPSCTITVPTTHVVISMPRSAWETINSTLEMDRRSTAFDPELRQEIGKAQDAVEIHEPPAPRKKSRKK